MEQVAQDYIVTVAPNLFAELSRAWDELIQPGSPFEIVESDVRGLKVKTFRHALPDVRTLWLSTAQFRERDYLVYEDERLTYAEAHDRVAAIANWMVRHGVKSEDRIGIAMRNYPEWMLIYWACACIGATAVGFNAWWTAPEMAYALQDCAPRMLFADQERLDRLEAAGEFPDTQLVAVRAASMPARAVAWADAVADVGELPAVAIDPDSDVCIYYTSGTTGFPKGAQLTHRSCINNLMNMGFAAQVQSLALQRAAGITPPPPPVPSTLMATPLFHVSANNCGAYPTTAAGGKIILMHRWDAGEALKLIERERCTSAGGVPSLARELVLHPDFDKFDTSSLLAVGGGGSQLLPDLVAKIDARIPTAQPTTAFGMTETSGVVTMTGGAFFLAKPESCGRAMPTFDVKILDDAGCEMPQGAIGELWVKGGSVVRGYLNQPGATTEAIVDGWLSTGDIAFLDDDDFISIVDRKKDMVLRGGENIYCAEVEAALHQLDAVAECAVFGITDERLGEEVGAVVFPRHGCTVSPAMLREHCSSLIARHKVPRYIWISQEPLPRNAAGKLLKRELRDQLAPSATSQTH